MTGVIGQLVAHKGIRWITIGWSGFIAENLILSHNKEWLVDRFDENQYIYGYTALSLFGLLHNYFLRLVD